MTPILLTPGDLALAALLLVADGVLSLVLGLGLHKRLAISGVRMVVQLAFCNVIETKHQKAV